MYQSNDQFGAATRQFADAAAQINRIALQNTERAFQVQLAAFEQNANATFAFWGKLLEARDFDAVKGLWPKGVQVARENVQRSVGAAQEVLGQSLKANESIGQVAKGQFDATAAKATAEVDKAAQAASKAAR